MHLSCSRKRYPGRVSLLITQPSFRISGKVNKITRYEEFEADHCLRVANMCATRATLHLNLRSIYVFTSHVY